MFHVQYIVLRKHRNFSWVRNNEATPTAQPRFLMLHATFLGKPANQYAHRSDRYPHGANGSQCGGHWHGISWCHAAEDHDSLISCAHLRHKETLAHDEPVRHAKEDLWITLITRKNPRASWGIRWPRAVSRGSGHGFARWPEGRYDWQWVDFFWLSNAWSVAYQRLHSLGPNKPIITDQFLNGYAVLIKSPPQEELHFKMYENIKLLLSRSIETKSPNRKTTFRRRVMNSCWKVDVVVSSWVKVYHLLSRGGESKSKVVSSCFTWPFQVIVPSCVAKC